MIEKRERRGLFYAHTSRSNPAIAQCRRRDFRRALILLTHADFGRELQRLAQAPFFKLRHDEYGFACARKHEGKEALADSPADAGEVVEGSPGSKEQSVVFWLQLRHQYLCALQPFTKFIGRDRPHSSPQRLQSRKRLRQPSGPIHIRGAYCRRQRERGGSRGTNQKLASRSLVKVFLI